VEVIIIIIRKKIFILFSSDYNTYSCNDDIAEMGDNPINEDKNKLIDNQLIIIQIQKLKTNKIM